MRAPLEHPNIRRVGTQLFVSASTPLLYERWLEVVDRWPDKVAVRSIEGVQTFAELNRAIPTGPSTPSIVFPKGRGVDFLLTVLQGWKHGLPVLPIEISPPELLPPFEWLKERDIAHIKTTSGSTGAARQVLFHASQLVADVDNIVSTMGLEESMPNLAIISLAHSYGFSNLVLPLLLHGIPLFLVPDPLPSTCSKSMSCDYEFTVPAVPAMWRAWRDAGVIKPQIKLAISAGAPLTLELETSIYERFGVKVHNFYGSSECGGIAYDRTTVPRTEASLAGTAMDNVALSLAGNGRLEVSSSAVAEGYWPEENVDLGKGKFTTSDLAEISPQGIRLTGRASDTINVAGRKIDPSEIEAAIQSHPSVLHCVVFGQPSTDAERHEEIVAIVSLKEQGDLAAVRSSLTTLSPWQRPRHWKVDADLKPNARGKISRAEWKQRF